jgi:hypothetical protein
MRQFTKALKGLARQPSFMVAFLVLLIAAVGLNAATQFLKLHYKKLSVPLAAPLDTIPIQLGDWICVSKDELNDEMIQNLATEHYIFRDYVNLKTLGLTKDSPEITQFDNKSAKERKQLLGRLRGDPRFVAAAPRAIMNMAVTYYTGKADTVAHIPDRCYVADGYEPTEHTYPEWNVNARLANRGDGVIEVNSIVFDDSTGVASHALKNVAYFFHTNGHYTNDPTQVRIALQNLFEKYGYYAKVELMTIDPNHQVAEEAMQEFLTQAIKPIEETLPNWNTLPR